MTTETRPGTGSDQGLPPGENRTPLPIPSLAKERLAFFEERLADWTTIVDGLRLSPETEREYKNRYKGILDSLKRQRPINPDVFIRKLQSTDLEAFDACLSGVIALRKYDTSDPEKIPENRQLADSLGFALLETATLLDEDFFYKWLVKNEYFERLTRRSTFTEKAEVRREEIRRFNEQIDKDGGDEKDKLSEIGDPKLGRFAGEKEKKSKSEESQIPYTDFDPRELIVKALIANDKDFAEREKERAKRFSRNVRDFFGPGIKYDHIVFQTSGASICLRREGYRIRGAKRKIRGEKDTKNLLSRAIGQGVHFAIERTIKDYLPRHILQVEVPPIMGEVNTIGQPDVLFYNLVTKEYYIIDIKTTDNFGFRQITRDGLPDHLRSNPMLSAPKPEDELQTLDYTDKRRNQGYNVTRAYLVYLNLDSKEMKVALVPWAENEYKLREFESQKEEAKEKLAHGHLPDPTVKDPKRSCKFCDYLAKCEPGQALLKGKIKRGQKWTPFMEREMRRSAAKKAERTKDQTSLGI